MVYYGILKEEDAQCFRVEARIEGASYVLAVGSILLALLNTFVMRAVNQYFRDEDLSKREFKAVPGRDGEEIEDNFEALRRIKPVPVLFTDAFRWFLKREDSDPSRHIFVTQSQHDHTNEDHRDLLEEGESAVADYPISQQVHSSPLQAPDMEEYFDEASYFENPDETLLFDSGISPVPRPRQPEILLAEESIVSNEATHDNKSTSVATCSLDYYPTEPRTVLSGISELTEPQTEPWKDV